MYDDYVLKPGIYSTKKTSEEWYNEFYKNNLTILDGDGWDRQNWNYSWGEELITRSEFEKRLCSSTVIWNTPKL